MNFTLAKDIIEKKAVSLGIREYDIYYQLSHSVGADALDGEISSFTSGVSGGICFRCIVNGKMGVASTQSDSCESLEGIVESAWQNAECMGEDVTPVIYHQKREYTILPKSDYQLPDAQNVRENALHLLQKAKDYDKKVQPGSQSGVQGFYAEIALSNSNGITLENRVGTTVGYVEAIVKDGEDSQSAFSIGENDLETLPKEAVDEALSQCNADFTETGTYPVVFTGKVFREFLSVFSDAFDGKNVFVGMSRLKGKLETEIASKCVTITDDAMREGRTIVTAFDDEGVPTYRKTLVENGILKQFLYDLMSAEMAGAETTGNGRRGSYSSPVSVSPFHFCIEAGKDTRETLLKKADNGILVTACKGFHAGANPVTGDFSIESNGFLIENGVQTKAIKSFTVAGNFFDLLQNIVSLGNKIDWQCSADFTSFGSPDILVNSLSVAGK